MIAQFALLAGAGLLAGAMNAVAGGGTFVSLPALTAVGLPGTVANATSSAALLPGSLSSAWAYRRDMHPLAGADRRVLAALSLVGGGLGAVLLLASSEHAFDLIVPWLLLAATIALAVGPRLNRILQQRGARPRPAAIYAAQFALGVYGGYFGGAVGLMMLAAWGLLGGADVARMAPLRTIMVAAANTIAVALFVASGQVDWPGALSVMAGAIAGGWLGAQVGRRLPPLVFRALVLTVTVGTTAIFFWRAYGR
ncbi:MAG: sulfite exporter TauE/SafE family protein [Caulobacterales bacterium]|nr:sulfite exporter TauE/SafE family protein [Caulobacterales bacterium]